MFFLQNWHEKKDLSSVGRCSWKFVAIVFILLSIIFLSALTYLAGKKRSSQLRQERKQSRMPRYSDYLMHGLRMCE